MPWWGLTVRGGAAGLVTGRPADVSQSPAEPVNLPPASEQQVRSHAAELVQLAARHGITALAFASPGRQRGHVADGRDLSGMFVSKSLSRRFPVTVTQLLVTRCEVCRRTVAYRPGRLSEVLTEHYRRAHPEALGVPSR
jgi:hypothetical protein